MSRRVRCLVSAWVAVHLAACATPPPEYTPVPVADPGQLPTVRNVVLRNDTVFVTTKADATRACRLLKIEVTTVDDTVLYGYDAQNYLVELPLADIASMEIYRPQKPDPEPHLGLSSKYFPHRGGFRDALGFLVVDLVVVAVQIPYYGIKYTYQAVRDGLADPPPPRPLIAADPCSALLPSRAGQGSLPAPG